MSQLSEEPVVVGRFPNPMEAQAARIALECEDIECLLMDEAQAAYPGMPFIPVRLLVHPLDQEEALAILREKNFI